MFPRTKVQGTLVYERKSASVKLCKHKRWIDLNYFFVLSWPNVVCYASPFLTRSVAASSVGPWNKIWCFWPRFQGYVVLKKTMEHIVPGALQRLSAADIIRMAGLAAASQGQEYNRSGVVHSTQRRGARLAGIVEAPHPGDGEDGSRAVPREYAVTVEIQGPTTWSSTCLCGFEGSLLCAHAAALLYCWLARPADFLVPQAMAPVVPMQQKRKSVYHDATQQRSMKVPQLVAPALAVQGPVPPGSTEDLLRLMGLSELRGIAREYEIVTNGLSKQQLADTVFATLQSSEAVRRAATALEKPQRQLLAAVTLAGGSVTDEDLRGIFERFALGPTSQLQNVLLSLQNKALLLCTSLNSSSHQRIGLTGSLIDIGWYVPREVRAALRVSVPITVYAVEQAKKNQDLSVQSAADYDLLADLLLIARALDGFVLTKEQSASEALLLSSMSGLAARDGSMPVPAPDNQPAASLLAYLHERVERPPALLYFAVCLLRLADVLHLTDDGTALRILPNAAELLLGPERAEAMNDLFTLWLTRSSYDDLYNLQEEGLRLRCRSTALNHPILRQGELDAENKEARQVLLALLAQVPLDQWVSFPSFARFVHRLNPLFLQKRQRLFPAPHWWLERQEGRPLRPNQLAEWQQAELRYLERLLSGPLHWWGICDRICNDDGHIQAFRLTPIAGALLGQQSLPRVEAEDDYQILANALEAVDSETLLLHCSISSWPAINLLENFATVAGVRSGRLCYQLSPAALGEAMSRGMRAEELLRFLRMILEHRPSESLALMLKQLEQRSASYGSVRIYKGVSLVEAADTMVMRELSTTTSVDIHVVRSPAPNLLIVRRQGIEQVSEMLKKRSQPPLQHEEDVYGTE